MPAFVHQYVDSPPTLQTRLDHGVGGTVDGEVSDHSRCRVAQFRRTLVHPLGGRPEYHPSSLVDELTGYSCADPVGGAGPRDDGNRSLKRVISLSPCLLATQTVAVDVESAVRVPSAERQLLASTAKI